MKPRKYIWTLIATLIAATVTIYVFRNLVRFPHRLVHELGGDGIKNYFAYIYHSMYGSGWWFEGMNYPYGEHIMFVDGQPALTVTLSWLRRWWQFTPEILNVILNISMVFAFLLAIVYLYKVLTKLNVVAWWAMLFAPLIVTISMQNFRMFGLYGLSYACVIPMMFYWFINYYESGKLKYMFYLFVLAGIVMLLHPYQLALILIWSVFYVIGYCLLVKTTIKIKFQHTIPVILVPLTAFIILKSILAFTNPVTDRPEYPHGLLSYGTTGIDIFTNGHSPYWAWIQEKGLVSGAIGGDAQSYAYTGMAAILIAITTIVVILVLILRKRYHPIKEVLNKVKPIWLFIAAGALLFSMGVPFVWGMEWAFDYISSLRQFRSLGWFALLFYYIVTVMSVVVITHYAARLRASRPWLSRLIIVVPFCVWAFEAWGIGSKLYKRSTEGNYYYDFFYSKLERDWQTFIKDSGYDAKDFQAILYIPYYHVGSEKIWLSRSGWGFCVSLKAAFQLQLPVADANMSRSSWSRTFEHVKVSAGPYAYKELLHHAKDNRPYLLLHYEGEELTPDERYLFDFADSIGVNSNLVAYALYPAQLAELEKKEWERVIESKVETDTPYYYEPFSVSLNREIIFGKGAHAPVTGIDTVIADIDVSEWPKDKLLEASAWFMVNSKDYRTPFLEIKYLDTAGMQLSRNNLLCGEANDIHDMWFRASKYFTLPDGTHRVLISLNVTSDVLWHGLDEIMIRAAEDTIIMKDHEGRIMVNNHLLQQ